MNATNIKAVLIKQSKDTLKNKESLIQFVLMPIMAIIMQNSVQVSNLPKNYFVNIFCIMFVGMAPLTVMASIIAEEKEKNTLRVLLTHNVKPMEYLLGVGSLVTGCCMLGVAIFAIVGGYSGSSLLYFLLIMVVGIIISIVVGAMIGLLSKNQMMATSISVPAMMLLSFLPMLSIFNSTIRQIARVTYTGQMSNLIDKVEHLTLSYENILVLGANCIITAVLFVVLFRKSKLH